MRRIIALKKKPLKGKRDYRPRRVWTLQQKLDLLERSGQPGSSASAVAREHDLDVRLIFQWRSDLKAGLLAQKTWGQPRQQKKAGVTEIDTLARQPPGEPIDKAIDKTISTPIDNQIDEHATAADPET